MSEDRTAADVIRDLDTGPKPGRASDTLDAARMVREGNDQDRRQEQMVDGLNNPGGKR